MKNEEILLAFDTAISAGSVSLWKNREKLSSEIVDANRSSSEMLLPTIRKIINENEISLNEIDFIGINRGPGSYTGIRVGLATAMGLQKSTESKLFGLSSFEILASECIGEGKVIAGIWAGRNEIAFSGGKGSDKTSRYHEIISLDEFIETYEKTGFRVVLDERSAKAAAKQKKLPGNFRLASDNVSISIAEFFFKHRNKIATSDKISPFYTREFFGNKK